MRQAQVLVFEADGKLAQLLRDGVERHGWRLRELRRADSVADVVREGAPVLIVKLGRDLYEELALLEQLHWNWPEIALIVVVAAEHPELTALVWDMGATFVLRPADTAARLPELVHRLMVTAES